MPKLYRPHIPLSVRVKVAERQLRERDPTIIGWVLEGKKTAGQQLEALLRWLAASFVCEVSDLRLDHDPALGARQKRGEGRKTVYMPDANDPGHLFYRPHGPEHDGSHLIKTNVRGDHGQHPDRVLIKKNRRLERGPKPKRPSQFSSPQMRSKKSTWPKRPFPKRDKL